MQKVTSAKALWTAHCRKCGIMTGNSGTYNDIIGVWNDRRTEYLLRRKIGDLKIMIERERIGCWSCASFDGIGCKEECDAGTDGKWTNWTPASNYFRPLYKGGRNGK